MKHSGSTNSVHDTVIGKKSSGCSSRGWLFRSTSSSNITFHLANDSTYNEIEGTITSGIWQHITGVRNGTTIYLYVNGKLAAQETDAIYDDSMDTDISLKMGWLAGWNYWEGQIDDVKIYNYARSASQIAYDYNRGKPVGWWKMDEGEGISVYDYSGNNNTGTMTTMDPPNDWVTGKYNKALDFDGSNDNVNIPDPASGVLDFGTNDFSVATWFKTTGDGNLDSIADKYTGGGGSGYILGTCSGNLCAYVGSGGVTVTGSAVNDGNWHHGVIVRNGDNARLYLDGRLNNSATGVSGNSASSNGSLYLGIETGNAYAFPGQIDDVRVYNYALTAQQVKQVMNDGAVRYGP
jgi:hypothetical protein